MPMPFLPPMTGNGKHTTYIFMVMTAGLFIVVLPTLLKKRVRGITSKKIPYSLIYRYPRFLFADPVFM
jgi:hypothetical protein